MDKVGEGERVVGGVAVQGRSAPPPVPARGHAQPLKKKRGRPKGTAAPRHCKRCVQFKGNRAAQCNGKNGRTGGASGCQYFTVLGVPLK